MNSNLNASNIKIKHNSKVKKHWEYDPVTGEEQESFIDIIPLEEKPKQTQQDLFSYREEKAINHSVNCYFCADSFDEREGIDASPFNDNDGGTICQSCLEKQPDLLFYTDMETDDLI